MLIGPTGTGTVLACDDVMDMCKLGDFKGKLCPFFFECSLWAKQGKTMPIFFCEPPMSQTPNHAISCTPNCPPSVVPGASYSPSGTPYSRGNYGLFLNFAFRVKFEKDHNFPQNWMATEFELESGSIHHPLITCNTVITCNWEINRYNSKDIHGGVSLTPSRRGDNKSRFGAPLPPDCDECMTWYNYVRIYQYNIV